MLIVVIFFLAPFAEKALAAAKEPRVRVLFIGNSLTFQNDLPGMLTFMCGACEPRFNIETAEVTISGSTLENHWKVGLAQKKIREGNWDFVVLQEYSTWPVKNKESMFTHMRLYDAEVKNVHARTLLYMNWALQKSPEDMEKITAAYEELGRELKAQVVPVGAARVMAAESSPEINLFMEDGKHPSPAGTYLAACVFFTAITHRPARGLPAKISDPNWIRRPRVDLTPAQASALQTVAEKISKTYGKMSRKEAAW